MLTMVALAVRVAAGCQKAKKKDAGETQGKTGEATGTQPTATGGDMGKPAAPADEVLALDEGHDLLAEVVVVRARGGRIDVLVAPDLREAIRHGHDHGPHLPRADEAVELRIRVHPKGGDVPRGTAGGRGAHVRLHHRSTPFGS